MKFFENLVKEGKPYWIVTKYIMIICFVVISGYICTSLINQPNTALVITGVVGLGLLFVFVIKTLKVMATSAVKAVENKIEEIEKEKKGNEENK